METKEKKEYIKIIILGVIILLTAVSIIFTKPISRGIKALLYKADVKASEEDLLVHFISVGQGDAIAIQFPNNKIMLIDAGPKSSQNGLCEYIKNNVLKSQNELIVDYVILTHPDVDHSGGLSMIFSEFEVRNFYRPNVASRSEELGEFTIKSTINEYDEAIKLANQEKDINIKTVNNEFEFYMEGVFVQIFPPVAEYETTNEMSCVVKVSYINKSFLFVGDIQGDSEIDMLSKYGKNLDADVLKVAHHGSGNSTSYEFVDMVSPEYAVICVGENSYGHPHLSTIATLQECNAKILTTKSQDIVFVCGKEMFGVLDNKTHSQEFIDWWIIAVCVEGVLIFILTKNVLSVIKQRRSEDDL